MKHFFIGLTVIAALAFFPVHAAKETGESSQSDSEYDKSDSTSKKALALYRHAISMVEMEKYKRAVKVLKKAVKKDDSQANYWNLLGFASRKIQDYDTAQNAYDKALAIDPNHLRANEYLGELYIQTNQTEKAMIQLEKLTQLCPSGCEELEMLTKSFAP